MFDAEKIVMAQALSGEADEGTVSAYLALAGSRICRKAFPFDPEATQVPARYGHLQVEIAVYLLNKRGAEGESAHSENGVSRSYESGDIPASMLRDIVPQAAVL